MESNSNRHSNSTATSDSRTMGSTFNTSLNLLRLWMGLGMKVYILNALTALRRWLTGRGAKSSPSPTSQTSSPTNTSSTLKPKGSSHRSTRSRSGGSSSSTGSESTQCQTTKSSYQKTKPKLNNPLTYY